MANEKSCGAIIYKIENYVRKYLIIRGTGNYRGDCGFPKGHMEEGETEQDTAIREVKEETGLDIVPLNGFRTVDEHTLAREGRPNNRKTNIYFLAECPDQDFVMQKSEVSEIVWVDYDEAMKSIQYEESRRELTEAEQYLRKMNKHKMIMLRGNSGSGKTTVAKGLQERFGRGTMVLSQDMIRREVLKERDGVDPPALPLIKQMLKYGSENCEVVILEGIFIADWYHELFEAAIEMYGSEIYAYYFDIPFEETVRRHQTRSKAAEFGATEMREWWKEKDYLDLIKETTITENKSKEEIINEIYLRVCNG